MGPPKASSSVPEVKNTSSAIKFAAQGGIVRVLICALIANTIVWSVKTADTSLATGKCLPLAKHE